MSKVNEVWVLQKLKQLRKNSATWITVSRPLEYEKAMSRLRHHAPERFGLLSGVSSAMKMRALVQDGY